MPLFLNNVSALLYPIDIQYYTPVYPKQTKILMCNQVTNDVNNQISAWLASSIIPLAPQTQEHWSSCVDKLHHTSWITNIIPPIDNKEGGQWQC